MSEPLAADRNGPSPSNEPPVGRLVFVHGFTQTRQSWGHVAVAFDDRYETITVDAPGHGESGALRLDLPAAADSLSRQTGPATYIGYSMGGRLALHVAVDHSTAVERLVLVSTTAGITDDTERAERRAADEQRARDLERDGVEAFLDRWLALPIFAGLPPDAARVEQRLANSAAGLASSLRLTGTGAQAPLWDRLGEMTMPVLVVAGARDAKFVAIAERLAAAIPEADLAIVAGAGHVVHLERPSEFVALLRRWLP